MKKAKLSGFNVAYTLMDNGGAKVPATSGPFRTRGHAENFLAGLSGKPNFISGEVESA